MMLPTQSVSAEAKPVARQNPLRNNNAETLSSTLIPVQSPSLSLGISWHNISIRAKRPKPIVKGNLISQLYPSNVLSRFFLQPTNETVVQHCSGCVKPGEMLLVMGNSAPKCSAFLDVLANRQSSLIQVEGDVRYGTMSHREYSHYKRSISGCSDENLFYPALTVDQTLDLAVRLGDRLSLLKSKEEIEKEKDRILDALGILQLKSCRVGDESSPGISKRERKLLALAEVLLLALHGSFLFLNNFTSGLDVATTSECLKTVRSLTTYYRLSTIVTLDSPTEADRKIFDHFFVLEDKSAVCSGTAANTEVLLEESIISFRQMLKEDNTAYMYSKSEEARKLTEIFKAHHASQSYRRLDTLSHTLRRMLAEIRFSLLQEFETLWLDRKNFAIMQISNTVQALTAGSLCYNTPHDSSGFAKTTGALFFSMLFYSLIPLDNIPRSFQHRSTVIKYGLLSRSWLVASDIAFSIFDLVVTMFQVSLFAVSFYFLVGLRSSAEAFFTYWMILVSMSQCLTGIFRFIGCAAKTLDGASMVAGLVSFATLVTCGYVVAEPQMPAWISWFFWINPTGQAYDALVANEYHDTTIRCVAAALVPSGLGYSDSDNQVCIGVGGSPRSGASLSGDQYLSSQSYGKSHIWRNVGIMWAYWLVFSLATVLVRMTWKPAVPSASRGGQISRKVKSRYTMDTGIHDEESVNAQRQESSHDNIATTAKNDQLSTSLATIKGKQQPVLTWKDVTVSQVVDGESTNILENIHGFIKSGSFTSFISPGSVSTTALEVLAQRTPSRYSFQGVLSLKKEFLERGTNVSPWAGYTDCTENYDPFVTVREALKFAALLRQPQTRSSSQIALQIETVLDTLALWDIADRLVSSDDCCLSPLQSRKVAIGLELVACPAVLFVEDPTLDLDQKAALDMLRILRRVAASGVAICVSFERQPLPEILAMADTVMALTKDGTQAYFGPVKGFKALMCGAGMTTDWSRRWVESSEYRNLLSDLEDVNRQLSHIDFTASINPKYSASTWRQITATTSRANTSMYRNTNYINQRIILHIVLGLYNGFCFFRLPQSAQGVQLRQSTIFNFIFVAPGIVVQQQSYFAKRRQLYEATERDKGMYGNVALTCSLILPELPYQCLCAFLYFVCWYYTVGLDGDAERTGAIFLTMLLYEFLYTGVGQLIMACVADVATATLLNPLILGNFVAFCGILVPYAQLETFWRSWVYWINPFTYFIGSLLNFSAAEMELSCHGSEAVVVSPMNGTTCADYLANYLGNQGLGRYLLNPDAMSDCQICPYSTGTDWLRTKNLKGRSQGWQYIGIMVSFVIFFYAVIFLVIELRNRQFKRLVRRTT